LGDAAIETEGAHSADQVSAVHNHAVAHPMQRLEIDLLWCPNRNESYRATVHCFGNGRRVYEVAPVSTSRRPW
jgi:hypothetical protein